VKPAQADVARAVCFGRTAGEQGHKNFSSNILPAPALESWLHIVTILLARPAPLMQVHRTQCSESRSATQPSAEHSVRHPKPWRSLAVLLSLDSVAFKSTGMASAGRRGPHRQPERRFQWGDDDGR
jgi:hypothetical protein